MPKQPLLLLVGFAGTLLLSGCHADITERIIADANDKVSVTYLESLDSELFSAANEVGGTDPFRFDSARSEGWQVSDSATNAGGHLISYSKTASIKELSTLKLPDGDHSTSGEPLDGFNFSPSSALSFRVVLRKITPQSSGLKGQILPALSSPDQVIVRPGHDPNTASAVANALQNATAIDSVVDVHLEIKTPNDIIVSNGHTMGDGRVNWDLHFARSAAFEYDTKDLRAQIEPTLVSVDESTPDRNDPSTPPMPPAADWSAVYASGVAYGASPFAAWQSIGKAGTYDFTRWGHASGDTDQSYRPARAFALGVYLEGAGISKSIMDATMELVASKWT